MMENGSVRKDYVWNTIGVFLQNAISPLLLIVITRINGIYDSGIFSFAFSVALIFWAFGMWGGRTYQVSDVKHEFSARSYIMVRLVLTAFMVIGAAMFVIANHYDAAKNGVIIVLVLFKAIESIADAVHGVLQVHSRLYTVGKSLTYKAVGGFALFVLIDLLTRSILLSSIGIVAVNILVIIFYDIRIARKLDSIRIGSGQLTSVVRSAFVIMKRCAPVFAVIFLAMFSLNIPRYFVDLYHQEQIGYFGILAMPITLIALMMTFILQPKVVELSKLYEKQEYLAFHAIVKKLALITVCIGLVVLLVSFAIGIPVLEMVFGISFSEYKTALMIIIAGGIINAGVSILINMLTIIRHFKHQFYTLLITNIILVVFSAMFIREYGLLGGVTLFVLVNIVQVVLLATAYKVILRRALTAKHSNSLL